MNPEERLAAMLAGDQPEFETAIPCARRRPKKVPKQKIRIYGKSAEVARFVALKKWRIARSLEKRVREDNARRAR